MPFPANMREEVARKSILIVNKEADRAGHELPEAQKSRSLADHVPYDVECQDRCPKAEVQRTAEGQTALLQQGTFGAAARWHLP